MLVGGGTFGLAGVGIEYSCRDGVSSELIEGGAGGIRSIRAAGGYAEGEAAGEGVTGAEIVAEA